MRGHLLGSRLLRATAICLSTGIGAGECQHSCSQSVNLRICDSISVHEADVAADPLAVGHDHSVIDRLEQAGVASRGTPANTICAVTDDGQWRRIREQKASRDAAVQHIEDGIQNLAHLPARSHAEHGSASAKAGWPSAGRPVALADGRNGSMMRYSASVNRPRRKPGSVWCTSLGDYSVCRWSGSTWEPQADCQSLGSISLPITQPLSK
jgi:hypothetical protein